MSNTSTSAGLKDIRRIVQGFRQARRTTLVRFIVSLCVTAMIVGLLDFVLFLAGALYFGGDAVDGKVEAGRYYLYGYHHGTKGYIEVSQAVFNYSKWHAYSLMVTWPLMFVGAFVAVFVLKRIGRRPDC